MLIKGKIQKPNEARIARCRQAPELGPRLLFFSGGSALRAVSEKLIEYTHNSVHIITSFDSGGSSARLKEKFKMLGVGDLRNRLMALADRSVNGHSEIIDFLSYRFPERPLAELHEALQQMVEGEHPMIAAVPDSTRKIIRSNLYFFQEQIDETFDLAGASIGNLILTGGYINHNRHIDPVVVLFSKLVEVRGIVRPVANEYLHLCAELENGEVVVGQDKLTGKECVPITSPVKNLYLSDDLETAKPADLSLRPKVIDLIKSAELICYPMGSFYSSIIANFLPDGVGQAISEVSVPKIYIANISSDAEEVGMGRYDCVNTLLKYLQNSCSEKVEPQKLLNYVLIDSNSNSISAEEERQLENIGLQVVRADIADQKNPGAHMPERVIDVLLSFS